MGKCINSDFDGFVMSFKIEVPNEGLSEVDIRLLVSRLHLTKGDTLNWEKTVAKGVTNMRFTVVRQNQKNDSKKPEKESKSQPQEKSLRHEKESKELVAVEHSEKAKSFVNDLKEGASEAKKDKDKSKKRTILKGKTPEVPEKSSEESQPLKNFKKKSNVTRRRSTSTEGQVNKFDSREKDRSVVSKMDKKEKSKVIKHNIFKDNARLGKRKRSDSSLTDTEAETEETSSNDLFRTVESQIESIHQLFGIDKRVIAKRWLDLGNVDDVLAEIKKEQVEIPQVIPEPIAAAN